MQSIVDMAMSSFENQPNTTPYQLFCLLHSVDPITQFGKCKNIVEKRRIQHC